MAKCLRCNRKGIVSNNGLCEVCYSVVNYEQYKAKDWTYYQEKKAKEISELQAIKARLSSEISYYEEQLKNKKAIYDELAATAKKEAGKQFLKEHDELSLRHQILTKKVQSEIERAMEITKENDSLEKKINTSNTKLIKSKELLKSIEYALSRSNYETEESREAAKLIEEAEEFLLPTVELKLQCMNVRQLRKEYQNNQKIIKEVLAKYSSKYTTKISASVYRLMVIALEAELQNILYNIKYGKLQKAISDIRMVTAKYELIAIDGNQTIAPTIKRFVGEVECLFIRAIEIEYEYYVQSERAKEEQRAIREQIRQETAERRELERQRRHIEKEESKYSTEMASVAKQLRNEQDAIKIRQLEDRLARLQEQLNAVNETKEEILKLQTGKAGNVYIISNLGSYGDSVFKIGMTRRIDPSERVRELGGASVPFPFDVHSYIFSDNAVELEANLHKRLHNKRMNKVNLRKEFFRVTIDELENLVYELEPSAEFNRTLLAEQYHQSLSIIEIPKDYKVSDFDEEDDDFNLSEPFDEVQ